METWEARAETGLTQAMPNTYRARQLSLPGDRERPERMCSNLSVLFLVHSRLKVLGEKKKSAWSPLVTSMAGRGQGTPLDLPRSPTLGKRKFQKWTWVLYPKKKGGCLKPQHLKGS